MEIDEEFIEKLKKEQLYFQNVTYPYISEKDLQYVAGMDVQHGEDVGFVAYQIFEYKTGKVLEENIIILPEKFPYLNGFLYYREKHFMEEALKSMKLQPNLIACDGNGLLHPRKMGEALHFGIVNNIPTIGIAKRLMQVESCIEIENKLYLDNIFVAEKVWLNSESKNPMIVSAGYKTNTELAVRIVKHMQQFSQNTRYSYLTKGSDHLAREAQQKYLNSKL